MITTEMEKTQSDEVKETALPVAVMAEEKEVDPYLYGWRYVQRTRPNGEVVWESDPLTLEDILHPQVGDYRMHAARHEQDCAYLLNVFSRQTKADPHAVVLHDLRVAWDHPTIAPHGPDLAVIFNVKARKNWTAFDCREEGTKPTLLVEITSPATREVDLVRKVDHYEEVGVPYYLIVDYGVKYPHLILYVNGKNGFTHVSSDERGWVWIEPLQLFVELTHNALNCYDVQGQLFLEYADVSIALEAETKRAEAEKERADSAENELNRLRALLKEQGFSL